MSISCLPAWSESGGCWHLVQPSKTDPGLAGCLRLHHWWGIYCVHLWPPAAQYKQYTVCFLMHVLKIGFFLWTMFSDLSCNGYLIVRLKPQRTLFLVGVVESDGHCSLGDASQTIFVHQILEICGTNLQGLQTSRITLWLIKIIFLKHVHYHLLKILKIKVIFYLYERN